MLLAPIPLFQAHSTFYFKSITHDGQYAEMPFRTLPPITDHDYVGCYTLTHKAFRSSQPPSSAPVPQCSHLRQCSRTGPPEWTCWDWGPSTYTWFWARLCLCPPLIDCSDSSRLSSWQRAAHSEIPARLWFEGREESWRTDIKMPTLTHPCFLKHSKLNC